MKDKLFFLVLLNIVYFTHVQITIGLRMVKQQKSTTTVKEGYNLHLHTLEWSKCMTSLDIWKTIVHLNIVGRNFPR